MDDSNSKSSRKDLNNGRELQDHSKRCSEWEERCIAETESDSSAENLYSSEQQNHEQKLWLLFQNTASAIAQLYKDRAQGCDDMWISFQNAAEIATNMYRDSIEGCRKTSESAMQCGYHRRNKEILMWAKKRRRPLRREDLIGYLCGRSPPHRVSRPTSSLSRSPSLTWGQDTPDSRLQTFHDAVSMNGLNGAMADISVGNEASLRRTASPGRSSQAFHPDLMTFISEEFKRRKESVCGPSSPSRKRACSSVHDLKPSSPKRRK